MPLRWIFLAVLLSLLATSAESADEPIAAPAADRGRVIEEIIVTAQKRAENVREVPVSMSVLESEFLIEHSITDFRDISQYSPSTQIDTNSLFPDIRMRGFGSPLANKGFEQPVGLVLDGVPYGRDHYFQGPIFDLERVEVLRGPQGTLFGKNTTAGVFNVVTKNPTDVYTGSINLELGELNRRRFEGAVGGPLIRNFLNFRLAGLFDERDGIVDNTTHEFVPAASERGGARERKALRAKLAFPDLFGANLVLSYERVATSLVGAGWELIGPTIPQGTRDFFRQFDPKTDFVPDNFVGSVDGRDFSNIDIETLVANASYDLGGWTIDAVAGHSQLEFRANNDADFTPAPLFTTIPVKDDNPSITFELRGTSPKLSGFLGLERFLGLGLGSSDFTAGFFYQRKQLTNSVLAIQANLPVVAEYLAAQGFPLVVAPGAPNVTLVPSGFFPPLVLDSARLGSLDTSGGIEETTQYFDQTSTTVAGFGHLNWHLTDRWTLESGVRFTSETKDASISRKFTKGTGLLFRGIGMEEFSQDLHLSELAFTPKVSLKYDWTDDIGFYAFFAQGFKAGGFNEQASNPNGGLVYGPEKATDFEIGTKMRLFDGAAALNLGLFRETVDDLQVLSLQQLLPLAINAGKARTQGVELDGAWLATGWLTLVGTLGFDDAKYIEFPNGACPQDQPGSGSGCDLSGQSLARTPKWTSTLTPSVRFPLTSIPGVLRVLPLPLAKIDLVSSLTVQYKDSQLLDENNDPRTRQPSFIRLNGSIGLGSLAQGWSLGITVANLTDEVTATRIRELTFGPAKFAQIPDPPRLVFGSFRWGF